MEFEPVIPAGFEPRMQTGSNPFESGRSNRTGGIIIRHLISDLIVFCKKTARTTLRIVARAEMLVLRTASALMILGCRREGGSK